jgi:hypothetical protein
VRTYSININLYQSQNSRGCQDPTAVINQSKQLRPMPPALTRWYLVPYHTQPDALARLNASIIIIRFRTNKKLESVSFIFRCVFVFFFLYFFGSLLSRPVYLYIGV